MTQVARPISDVSNSGWSPAPLNERIHNVEPNDANPITSSPSYSVFEVRLPGLAWPGPGEQAVTVRYRKTAAFTAYLSVTLLQGSTAVASRTFSQTTSYADYKMTLTAAEVALITDYTNLRIKVVESPAQAVTCCPSNPFPQTLTCTLTNSGGCACMAGAYSLVWNGTNWSRTATVCGGKTLTITFTPSCGLTITCGGEAGLMNLAAGAKCDPIRRAFAGPADGYSVCCSGNITAVVTE